MAGPDRFDRLNSEGSNAVITVGTSPVEVKVGSQPLADRSMVHLQADDNRIYWGYSNTVTTSDGTRLFKGQFMPIPVGPDISIWVVADGPGRTLRIGELA